MSDRERLIDDIVAISSEIGDLIADAEDKEREISHLEEELNTILANRELKEMEVQRLQAQLDALDGKDLFDYEEKEDGSVAEVEKDVGFTPELITYEEDSDAESIDRVQKEVNFTPELLNMLNYDDVDPLEILYPSEFEEDDKADE